MTINIFNPEHEIAIASENIVFTAPKAAKRLRQDLGFMPALWCNKGDCVLVENKRESQLALEEIAKQLADIGININTSVCFIERNDIKNLQIDNIDVWGWDKAIRQELINAGIDCTILPSTEYINLVKIMSHRRTAAVLLRQIAEPNMKDADFVLTVKECFNYDDAKNTFEKFGTAILKMPWSSSGRGIRYIEKSGPTTHQTGWTKNVIAKQGSIMVEPFYNKLIDFAMEFNINEYGDVNYEGLSVFHTENGQYRGNILATEDVKENIITNYVTAKYLHNIKDKIKKHTRHILNGYTGKFGVDMMIITTQKNPPKIHPCVEINLRRTIGHVALEVSPKEMRQGTAPQVMCIEFDGNKYRLVVRSMANKQD